MAATVALVVVREGEDAAELGALAGALGASVHEVPVGDDVREAALTVAQACEAQRAALALLGDDAVDRAVAAYFAQRVGGGVVTGVTSVRREGVRLVAERAVLSGNGVETCAVREGVLPVLCVARRASGARRSSATGLRSARVVVAGGAGVGGDDGMAALRTLAEALGGAVAASRGAIVNGWATGAEKVGLTGVSVTPDLYLAVGISGASQHMAGCRRARVLVAVNRDRGAPIFRYARYGVVADSRTVVDALLARLGVEGSGAQRTAEEAAR